VTQSINSDATGDRTDPGDGMRMLPLDSDASRAAVAVAAQRIAATCDKHGITIEQALCEELAELVLLDYRAFFAGVRFAQAHKPATTEPDQSTTTPDLTTVDGQSPAEPGE
jgi:hypothetical protein